MVEPGSEAAPERFHMTITAGGPYLVFGHPPLRQQFMLPNRDGEIWYFQAGEKYSTESEPTALCRCGHSGDKPYCDGSHVRADWDPSLTASEEPLLDGAERYEGPEVALTDNRAYCAFARFCDAKGQVWNLVSMEGKQARDLTVREADHCPAGRLSAWTGGQEPHEPHFEPSLGLIEDPQQGSSVARTDLPTKCGTGLPCAVAAGRRTSLSATGRTLRSVFRTDCLPVPIPTENVGSRNERNGSTWERGEFPMRFFMMRRAGGTSSALAPEKTGRESSRINPLEILYL